MDLHRQLLEEKRFGDHPKAQQAMEVIICFNSRVDLLIFFFRSRSLVFCLAIWTLLALYHHFHLIYPWQEA